MKTVYLRRGGKPFGVLVIEGDRCGWSLCDTQDHGETKEKTIACGRLSRTIRVPAKPDHFNRRVGRALAILAMGAGKTVDDAVRFALTSSPVYHWKQRALKDAIRREVFPILAARTGVV